MMRSALGLALLSSIMVMTAPGAFAIDVPLTYVKYTDNYEGFRAYGGTHLDISGKVPAGEWKLPETTGTLPLYYLLKFGAREHLLLLDRANEQDTFYTRMRLDANANRDLTDDPAFLSPNPGEVYDNQCSTMFGPFDVMVSYTNQPGAALCPVSVSLSVNTWNYASLKALTPESPNIADGVQVFLEAQCAYQGVLVSENGTKYSIVLGDANANGTFNDALSAGGDPAKGDMSFDMFFIAQGELTDYADRFVMSGQLLLEGTLYDVAVDIPQKKLTLTPTTKALVPLKLPIETDRLSLRAVDPADAQSIMMLRPGKEVQIPQGTYSIFGYTILQKDAKGATWRIGARASEKPAAVTVAASGGTIEFGEPFTPVVSVDPRSLDAMKRGESTGVQLVFQLEGCSKERVVDLRHTQGSETAVALSQKNPGRPQEPAYRVVTEDGEVVAQGSFDWG